MKKFILLRNQIIAFVTTALTGLIRSIKRLLAHNEMALISPRDEISVVLYENFNHLTPG